VGQFWIQGHEGVGLQLGEGDVLGVIGLGPAQLLGDLPGPAPEHGVAEEADRDRPDAVQPVEGDVARELAPVDGLVQHRQRLGAQQRRGEQLMPGRHRGPLGGQVEHGPAVDDEPGHDGAEPTPYRSTVNDLVKVALELFPA
jgi:hypothetical protein